MEDMLILYLVRFTYLECASLIKYIQDLLGHSRYAWLESPKYHIYFNNKVHLNN